MSVSDETYFEKYEAFTEKLYFLYRRDYGRDVTNIINATTYAPEYVRAYLATLAELLEQQTKMGDKIDEGRFLETAVRFPQLKTRRRADADAGWELIRAWDELIATCDNDLQEVAAKARTITVHYNGQIERRAS